MGRKEEKRRCEGEKSDGEATECKGGKEREKTRGEEIKRQKKDMKTDRTCFH